MMTNEQIARVCHEANRAMQEIQGDPAPSPEWDEAPAWQRESATEGVLAAIEGATPEDLHLSWWQHKADDGWRYGLAKDAEAKTHPCMIPYKGLPAEQRAKDHLFHAIVSALFEG